MGSRRLFGGGEPEYVEPEPEPDPDPISVEPDTVVLGYPNALSKSVKVTSPTAWWVENEQDINSLLGIEPTRGPAGETEVRFEFLEPYDDAMNEKVVFIDGNDCTARVRVRVCTGPISVEPSLLPDVSGGTERKATVKADCGWSVTDKGALADCVFVEPMSGSAGETEVTVWGSVNDGGEHDGESYTTVVFTDEAGNEARLEVENSPE